MDSSGLTEAAVERRRPKTKFAAMVALTKAAAHEINGDTADFSERINLSLRSKLKDHRCIKGRVVLEKCLLDGVLVVVMNLLQELAFWRSKSYHPCWERPETMEEKRPIKIVQTLQRLRVWERATMAALSPQKLKIGVVFSGGQALGTLSYIDHSLKEVHFMDLKMAQMEHEMQIDTPETEVAAETAASMASKYLVFKDIYPHDSVTVWERATMAALSPQKLKISVVFSGGQALVTLSNMDYSITCS
ncbi:hypothetical protein DY000_02016899 [Brassica cretica]|uniref:Uncharacterized protein n=1 Tax=Brassica cretica TaxID=69181 RepID=A0ABQ7D061_BRACR|nr:hypothetical protein DY000_02016899 [Brassica cretica]